MSGGRGGGRGGFHRQDMGPPETVLELGSFVHAVEDEMLCSSLIPDKVPHFNAPIYLQNKSQIGKIDEILGPVNEVYFSIKMEPGMVAASFKKGDKVYVSDQKLLPIERFLPKPKIIGGKIESKSELPLILVLDRLQFTQNEAGEGQEALLVEAVVLLGDGASPVEAVAGDQGDGEAFAEAHHAAGAVSEAVAAEDGGVGVANKLLLFWFDIADAKCTLVSYGLKFGASIMGGNDTGFGILML
ncbi:H/ACA ribonucleoprotein complex subunit 1 AltName: Full=snoRNP protein GAR1 [Rhizoctonia solani AG-1 IB]|uniref:H/ACA ribonucleoprotein complex subunit n=1 Tax=Thanatephorus cucumeris (strain AG1-IB / isolate 7/3/14) TaxID=1108050 RepID=M5BMP2_THACB|nr:H/ACA ribonucleoprotein complex subunit 1 AltName: Full=snoRNP protein GAR1 [Rhizoctonia solani AG-1 IB]